MYSSKKRTVLTMKVSDSPTQERSLIMESINKSINSFGIDVYKELQRSNVNNIFLSPISIASTLSMLTMGAKGDTATQLKNALGYNKLAGAGAKPPTGCRAEAPEHGIQMTQKIQKPVAPFCDQVEDVHMTFQSLSQRLISLEKETELKIATGMYTQTKFPISEEYLKCAHMLYHAQLESVDFQKDGTRQEINKWVENETQGKIKDLFSPDSFDGNTAMLLVNTICFKGEWQKQFDAQHTKEAPFYVSKDEVKSVQMMHQTEKCNVAIVEQIGAKILELPYVKGTMSMFILLTDERFGVNKIEQIITAEKLCLWTSAENVISTTVDLHFPKFKLEESYDLGQAMGKLGIVDAFSQQRADLSGISCVGLHVSKMLHKAVVEVNEQGTEAAAGTGVVIVPKMLPLQLKFDNPFIFYIKDKKTNCILFIGKCSSP